MVRVLHALLAALVLAGCSGAEPGRSVGACTVYSPDARGGRYAVGDAGVVEVYLERGQLVLVQLRPALGWESELVTEVEAEIVIAFVRGGDRLTFTASADDDVLAAQWCP